MNVFEIFDAEISLLSKLSSPVNGSNIQRMFSGYIPVYYPFHFIFNFFKRTLEFLYGRDSYINDISCQIP